jgi:hypothetical protein
MSDSSEAEVATTTNPEVTVYPATKVETLLGDWYDERMKTALRTPKSPDERRLSGGSVFDIQPELSSQQAVAVLLDLEEILGYEPKKKVIRRGGYSSRGQFVKELSARIESDYNDRHGARKPVASVVEVENQVHVQL